MSHDLLDCVVIFAVVDLANEVLVPNTVDATSERDGFVGERKLSGGRVVTWISARACRRWNKWFRAGNDPCGCYK